MNMRELRKKQCQDGVPSSSETVAAELKTARLLFGPLYSDVEVLAFLCASRMRAFEAAKRDKESYASKLFAFNGRTKES